MQFSELVNDQAGVPTPSAGRSSQYLPEDEFNKDLKQLKNDRQVPFLSHRLFRWRRAKSESYRGLNVSSEDLSAQATLYDDSDDASSDRVEAKETSSVESEGCPSEVKKQRRTLTRRWKLACKAVDSISKMHG